MSDKYTMTLEWEDDNFFEMKSRKNTEDAVLIFRCEENAHFGDSSTSIRAICENFFGAKLKEICDIMT